MSKAYRETTPTSERICINGLWRWQPTPQNPTCGNLLPVIDGGFSLQYSPLMEYPEGKGPVIIC